MVQIKGFEIIQRNVKDSHDRRALQFKNTIITDLKRLDLSEEQIDVHLESYAFRKSPASAAWFMDGHHLYYSYNLCSNHAENMFVVSQVIKTFIDALLEERITLATFFSEFKEDDDVEAARLEARKTLGVEHTENDMGVIDKKFKELAKVHHPDMPEGDTETFKAINKAHKILRRQLQ